MSAAMSYNRRRSYGGMDTDAAKELRELNNRLKRPLADAELEKDALRAKTCDTRTQGRPHRWASGVDEMGDPNHVALLDPSSTSRTLEWSIRAPGS